MFKGAHEFPVTRDGEGLKRFLTFEIRPVFRAQLAGAGGGPTVRLARQFEKAMAMLIRLREMPPLR